VSRKWNKRRKKRGRINGTIREEKGGEGERDTVYAGSQYSPEDRKGKDPGCLEKNKERRSKKE